MSITIDIIKYVIQHIPIIAFLYAACTYVANFIFQAFDQGFIQTGLASALSVQVMNILQMGLFIYIIVAFLVACGNGIAVAAARREALITGVYPVEGIDSGIQGSIVCMVFLMGAIIINFVVTAFFDAGIVTLDNSLPTPTNSIFYVLPQEQTLVNLAHIIPLAILFSGYLYLLFGAFAMQIIDYYTDASQ